MPDLAETERPREWIARHHPVDRCCDAAKRIADAITLHAIAGSAGRFVLIKLLDGRQVDQLAAYASREEAERFKTHPAQIAIQIPPGGIRGREAEEIIHYHREVYDNIGPRPLEIGYLMPLTRRDQRRQIKAMRGRH